ncbi:MAG: Fis family transcriptional regulator [Burkholderiaceae bacterium]|nr:MAG: Fis family transcriptional regulator [Burkholderiaceae bacterium]
MSKQSIEDCVRKSLEKYFKDLDGERPHALYDMMILTVERPLLEFVMQHTNSNQSEASALLGINRNTLRKKLQQHGLI